MTFSTAEKVVGIWIDGKLLYRKTINIGAMPNKTVKYIPHNISNAEKVIIDTSHSFAFGNAGNCVPLPYVIGSAGGTTLQIEIQINLRDIIVTSYDDRSSLSGYVTLLYTYK